MKIGINLQHEDADDANKGGLALDVAKPELKRPSMYAIVMQNDDYTPMDFVVEVLQMFFSKTLEEATHIMLTVHTKGSAVCAIHTRDIAETKASQVNQYSKDSQHPLLCEIVPIGDNE